MPSLHSASLVAIGIARGTQGRHIHPQSVREQWGLKACGQAMQLIQGVNVRHAQGERMRWLWEEAVRAAENGFLRGRAVGRGMEGHEGGVERRKIGLGWGKLRTTC